MSSNCIIANTKMLRALTYTSDRKLIIELPYNDPVHCHTILRLIPGKRLVSYAYWHDDQAIVAKIFFGWRPAASIQRELLGLQILQQANIPTPSLLYQGRVRGAAATVLLFAHIPDSITINPSRLLQEHQALLAKLVRELALQHVVGILQEDLHLNNFLITNDIIYTIDTQKIKNYNHPLTPRLSLKNLAALLAQFSAHSELITYLSAVYSEARSWPQQKVAQQLELYIQHHHMQLWPHYRRKIYRTSSNFVVSTKRGQRWVYARQESPAILQCQNNQLSGLAASHDSEMLKDGNSAKVFKLAISAQQVLVIKHYIHSTWWKLLKRCWRPSKASLSWQYAHYLRLIGINTIEPLGFIEERNCGLHHNSYLISKYIAAQDANCFFTAAQISEDVKIAKINAIIALLNKLKNYGLVHHDLKGSNILIDDAGEIIFIDLDSMKQYRNPLILAYYYKRSIKRLLSNWPQLGSTQ